MTFEASTHTLAYLGNEEQFSDDIDTLGDAIDWVMDAGHEIYVPQFWIQEDIISLYGLQDTIFHDVAINELNHESAVNLAELVLDRWTLPDRILTPREINLRSAFIDLELDLLQEGRLTEEVPQCMRDGITDNLVQNCGAIALFHGMPLAVREASVIFNEEMIPYARNEEYRSN